jgi:2-amino-4-hydroxy-6-hydroxymethyldihydropteridine diphosphokinase
MQRACIGLGSNLDDPVRQVGSALDELAGLPLSRLLRRSSLYRSPPMGPTDQPDYVNAAALIETALEPLELLDVLQAIEAAHGRRRELRWGPRTLDLDLLVYGDLRLDHPRLTLPHPGIAGRAFVLVPLAEIAPDLELPGTGSVAAAAAAVARQVDRIEDATSG